MKKYVNILDLTLRYLYKLWDLEKFRAPRSYSLWDLEKFRILPLHMGLATWRNSTPELPPGLWDLEKFQALPLYRLNLYRLWGLGKILNSASIQALRFEKMLSFSFLRLQPVGEVSLFCLLHISFKLFMLTYSSKPQKCECTSREHTTRKLIVVDVPPPI